MPKLMIYDEASSVPAEAWEPLVPLRYGRKPMDDELKTAAEAWLKASHDYYAVMCKRGLAGGCV